MTIFGIEFPETPYDPENKTSILSTNHFAALGKAGIVTQCDADRHTATILGTERRTE